LLLTRSGEVASYPLPAWSTPLSFFLGLQIQYSIKTVIALDNMPNTHNPVIRSVVRMFVTAQKAPVRIWPAD